MSFSIGGSGRLALAQSLLPSECKPEDGCLCLKESDAKAVGQDLVRLEQCEVRLSALQAGTAEAMTPQPEAFWQQPEILVGGVVVSFAFGGLIGWAFAKR